jgi:hypothetical protein
MNDNNFATMPLVVFSAAAEVLAIPLSLAPSGVVQRRDAGTQGWMQ